MMGKRLTPHNGYGVGFICPNENCDSDTAWIDFSTDEKGVLQALLIECNVCDEQSIERIGSNGTQKESS